MHRYRIPIFVFLTVLTFAGQVTADTKLIRMVKKIRPAVATVIVYDINNEVANIGTGFFINKKGHLVTNYHVLESFFKCRLRYHAVPVGVRWST